MVSIQNDSSGLMTKALNSISLTVKWLKQNEKAIDEISDLNAHYKACCLYPTIGGTLKSRYYADMMKNKYLRDDGDFRTEENNKGWYSLPCSPANRYVYSNGWIVTGMHRMGAYGIAGRGLDFLLQMQDCKTGGFYSRYNIVEKQPNRDYVDTSSTSSAGIAMIACGKKDSAVKAGEFVLKVISSQPDPTKFFFSSWLTEKGLHTDVFGDENQNSLYGRKQYCLDLKGDPKSDLNWLLGKPMKFLCRLYDLTGDKRYIEGAFKLFNCFDLMDDSVYDQLTACKVMWGGAELYRHTGDEKVGIAVCRILEMICDTQDSSGTWLVKLWYDDLKNQSFAMSLDVAQEMGIELSDVIFDMA